ncbi:BLUF domain-containing protein [Erythrobacter sp.]|uniref:BLUF domain-containing protein n=1 Tax=Erythrobacter sp. TaxID=1042 RepID=UPI001425E82D|nr:BLUF domain-containing protein [Erythrobacter sp.]QIQ87479.1 MAG: BLUF domain-containing protein [Erythrobacter sp.]
MREIIYQSVASEALGPDDVFRIVYCAKRSNETVGLSGFLIYSSGCFLQLLEGPHLELRRTFGAICRDRRHRDVRVLSDRPIVTRLFPDWHMRRIEQWDETRARRFLAEKLGERMPISIERALREFYGSLDRSVKELAALDETAVRSG